MASMPDPRCPHARLTPDGVIQRCVLDYGHDGEHLDQTVQRSYWTTDSDVSQPAAEPPAASHHPADDVELVDPALSEQWNEDWRLDAEWVNWPAEDVQLAPAG